MIICPNCGHTNRAGMLFCDNCGYGLDSDDGSGNTTIPTRLIDEDPDDFSAKATWGSARFSQDKTIIIHIRDVAEPMMISPAEQLIFGRSDETSSVVPDIDLADYGALEKGVSRRHAVLEASGDTLILLDVGSANGTYLNGQRLAPNQPRVLRDGDEVRLGKLVAHIYFK